MNSSARTVLVTPAGAFTAHHGGYDMASLPHDEPQSNPCSKCDNHPRQGKKPWCAECVREYNRAYYAKNRECLQERQREYEAAHRQEALERNRAWRARNPDGRKAQLKRAYERHRERERKRGIVKYYRDVERTRAQKRAGYRRNRDKYLAQYHKRRARILSNGGTYTAEQWRALCAQYDHTCLRCGQREPTIKLTPDHVVPLSRGGSNDISNIQPLCGSCNTSKGARTVDYREAWHGRAKS